MRIYAGNFSFDVTEGDLEKLFAVYGSVTDLEIIRDRLGRSRGFAFLEMPNQEEAMKAIISLNGKELRGRNLTVNEAKPRRESIENTKAG